MAKSVIAIDIDDVIADQAQGFLDFSNRMWGTNFSLDDYTEHWMELWGVDLEEVERRATIYHNSGTMASFAHKEEAMPVLTSLKERFDLVLVTSRRTQVRQETLDWVTAKFPDIFSDIIFAGFFDNLHKGRWNLTKADICKKIHAEYLVDDQLKHCSASASAGINTILFGDYPWNQSNRLPELVTRCKDWNNVRDYFDGR